MKKYKILYIGSKVLGKTCNGGQYVQMRNRLMLECLYDDVDIIEIPKIGFYEHIINIILKRSYGHTNDLWGKIKEFSQKKYDFVFFDGSYYGKYVEFFNKMGVPSLVFFHNVEYDFYRTKYKSNKSVTNFILIYYIRYNERLSLKNAYKLITLNSRDSISLEKNYGKRAHLILPTSYPMINVTELCKPYKGERFLLFVGADFCANNEGISWFIENVMPYVNIQLVVVGSCCKIVQRMVPLFESYNTKLLGFVDDLDSLYKTASGVVCPIFTGSGMKTKTIEALRYGKTVFGTSEAFMGVEADFDKIGGLCNSADSFIKRINEWDFDVFNENSYNLFLTQFSDKNVYEKFSQFVEEI